MSRHASGRRYRWVRDLDNPLPQVPPALRERLERPSPPVWRHRPCGRRPNGYLSAYCKPHQLERGRAWRQRHRPPRQHRPAPTRGADTNRLPSARCLKPCATTPSAVACRYATNLLGYELFAAYGNAHQAGTVSLILLERFCDEVLGWHPRMLYGDAYDRAALSTNGKRSQQDRKEYQ